MIVENVAAGIKIAPSFLGGAAGDLWHPLFIRMSGMPAILTRRLSRWRENST
jgi:hypothetical protein